MWEVKWREPGTYAYADNMSIEDVIVQAGGLRESLPRHASMYIEG